MTIHETHEVAEVLPDGLEVELVLEGTTAGGVRGVRSPQIHKMNRATLS